MRKLFKSILLLGVVSMTAFSCSTEEEPAPPGKEAQEQVKEVVKELEKNPEVSKFTEELKKIDVANVETEELTVFAVKNSGLEAVSASTKAVSITEKEVKRHIAKGAHDVKTLKDSTFLISITNDSLLIRRSGEDVTVNNVAIETTGVKVGKSIVYEVTKVIPTLKEAEEEVPVVRQYTAKITVLRCNDNWSVSNSAQGFPMAGATLEVYKCKFNTAGELDGPGELLKTYTTDKSGFVTIEHQEKSLFYKAYVGDSLSNVVNGFMIEGVFTSQAEIDNWAEYRLFEPKPGELKYKDVNNDGMIDNSDKVTEIPFREIKYDGTEGEAGIKESQIFLFPLKKMNWELAFSNAVAKNKADFTEYAKSLLKLDAELTNRNDSIGTNKLYATGLKARSTEFWNKAYAVIRGNLESNKIFEGNCPEEYKTKWRAEYERMQAESAVIYSTLVNFYGGAAVMHTADEELKTMETAAVIQYMDELQANLPAKYKAVVLAAKARVCSQSVMVNNVADRNAYERMKESCKVILDGEYMLLDNASAVFASAENWEALLGGYMNTGFAKGKYYQAVHLKEIMLMYAEACLELNQTGDALGYVNSIYAQYGMPLLLPQGSTDVEIRTGIRDTWDKFMLGEGFNYGNLRRWVIFTEYCQKNKITAARDYNALLPIPDSVLSATIKQNPGY